MERRNFFGALVAGLVAPFVKVDTPVASVPDVTVGYSQILDGPPPLYTLTTSTGEHHWPPRDVGQITLTVIGADNAKAQRELLKMLKSADRRGMI